MALRGVFQLFIDTIRELTDQTARLQVENEELKKRQARIEADARAALEAQVREYAKNFLKLARTPSNIIECSLQTMTSLLECDHLQVPSEDTVLDVLLKWIAADLAERQGHLADLLRHVRINHVSDEFLIRLLNNSNGDKSEVKLDQADCWSQVKEMFYQALVSRMRPDSFRSFNNQSDRSGACREVVVIVGGSDGPDTLDSAIFYNPLTGKWHPLAPMNHKRRDFALAVLDSHKILVIGGRDGKPEMDSVEMFNFDENSWTLKNCLAAPDFHSSAVVLQGSIYASGGFSSSVTNQFKRYDPAEDCWHSLAPMNLSRHNHTLTALRGRIYAIGGDGSTCEKAFATQSIDCYYPETDTWELFESIPGLLLSGHAAVAVEADDHYGPGDDQKDDPAAAATAADYIYLIGGLYGAMKSFRLRITGKEKKPEDFVLEELSSLIESRTSAAATLVDGSIWVSGGDLESESVEVFPILNHSRESPSSSPSSSEPTECWSLFTCPLPIKRHRHGMATLRLPLSYLKSYNAPNNGNNHEIHDHDLD